MRPPKSALSQQFASISRRLRLFFFEVLSAIAPHAVCAPPSSLASPPRRRCRYARCNECKTPHRTPYGSLHINSHQRIFKNRRWADFRSHRLLHHVRHTSSPRIRLGHEINLLCVCLVSVEFKTVLSRTLLIVIKSNGGPGRIIR